jgi:DMSO/TMAO reductase YedYZ molybdopterin-dependent catalytic subunit
VESNSIEELNRETPLQELAPDLTDNRHFYKRNHFPSPEIIAADWSLKIQFGSKVSSFTLDQLNSYEQRSVGAVLECAGNARSGFGIKVEGEIEWGIGAVGSALWSGVPLNVLLTKSGFSTELSEVTEALFVGSDGASEVDAPIESKKRFARGLPIQKAMENDTIVALRMNGDVLPKDHGFPARLVVPGWYAMASVKWLDTIILRKSDQEFQGYFNRTKYVYVTEEKTGTKVTPVTNLRVKTLITNPVSGQRVDIGKLITIEGKAWSGYGKITKVEINFGEGWREASISKYNLSGYVWTDWKYEWAPKIRGTILIRVRATDEAGNVQPESPLHNKYLYGYNAPQKIQIQVE